MEGGEDLLLACAKLQFSNKMKKSHTAAGENMRLDCIFMVLMCDTNQCLVF